jgi:hypothetical protein
VSALELRERLRVHVEVIEGGTPHLRDEDTAVLHPGGTGMKSAGDAISTLIRKRSFREGIARSSAASSGRMTKSTSIVEARHPISTAVVPPTR